MMFEMLLGHLVGDYLLQNQWMALNKAKYTLVGWIAALVHCIIYTASVCLFMKQFDWQWMIIVFLTHFPIDKFSLGELYMDKVKGYGLKKFINNVNNAEPHKYLNSSMGNNMLLGGFTAVVYAITDNTMHLVLMYIAYTLLY
jgi:hypothetical protein